MNIPNHVAIIMDGNGRWARQRFLPRIAGHKQGSESVRSIVTLCAKKKISTLTLFAFSSENWRRPESEVNFLLELFLHSLRNEIQNLHTNNVCLKVIGDRSRFGEEFQTAIKDAEHLTQHNTALQLNIALNYGGQWDIIQATQTIAKKIQAGELNPEDITKEVFEQNLSLADGPEPDLLIRTGGESRISNFMLWPLAYTELYFTETLWPDFRETQFEEALKVYTKRQRRFGHTGEQIKDTAPETLPRLVKLIEQRVHA